MNLVSLIPDNISEVLLKIIRFTELRRRILHRNLRRADTTGWVPRDVPVLEFAEALNVAVAEHLQYHRLLFRDTPNIRFGINGSMRIRPVIDEYARTLLDGDPDEYRELQINRLLENAVHRRVAEELLRQNAGTTLGLPELDFGTILPGDTLPEDLPSCHKATE